MGGPEFGKTCLYNTCTLPNEDTDSRGPVDEGADEGNADIEILEEHEAIIKGANNAYEA